MAVANQQILETLAQGDATIVLDALVGINDEKRETAHLRRVHGPRPVHMQHDAPGYGSVARFGHDPGGPQLRMTAAVGDGVGFGDVVQQRGGPHHGHGNAAAPNRRQLGQIHGQCRHLRAVRADVVQHAVFVPQRPAGVFIGNIATGRVGQAQGRQRRQRMYGRRGVGPGRRNAVWNVHP